MTQSLSRAELKAIQAKPKRSKYHAHRCEMDGFKFDSKHEMQWYARLSLLEKAGEISGLKLQHRFPLCFGRHLLGHYVADFVYRDKDGATKVIDAKGVRTDLYAWKAKHFKAQYGLEIEEV